MNFSSQNGVIQCILGVLFLRFMCHENDSDLRYSEVPLKGKNKALIKILGWGSSIHDATPAPLTPILIQLLQLAAIFRCALWEAYSASTDLLA